MVYFSSDWHLGHRSILKYRDGFKSLEEHDRHILDMLQSLSKRDIIKVLGDVVFDDPNYEYYISELRKAKCKIEIVMGNHDSRRLYSENYGNIEIQLPLFGYKNMWVSHAPIHPDEMRNRDLSVHGHLHNDIILDANGVEDLRYFNVNLDNNGFKFVSLDKIKERRNLVVSRSS